MRPGHIIGVTGADPCVGVIFTGPPNSNLPGVAYHIPPGGFYGGMLNYVELINEHRMNGYRNVYIVGGTENKDGNSNRYHAEFAAQRSAMNYTRIQTIQAGVDSSGHIYASDPDRQWWLNKTIPNRDSSSGGSGHR